MTRIEKIYAYKEKTDKKEKEKQEQINIERSKLLKKIQYLNLEIAELIDTAYACLKAGIEIDMCGRYGKYYDTYQNGTFVANAISHKLGFVIEEKNAVLGIGILKTGENCEFDLISEDYGNVYVRRTYSDSSGIKQREKVDDSFLSVSHFEYFLKEFPVFKESFYKYVDGILEAVDGQK